MTGAPRKTAARARSAPGKRGAATQAASATSRPAGERLALGLSSGTSADGIDAALIALRGAGDAVRAELRAFSCTPYPAALRRELLRLGGGGSASLEELARLDVVVGERFASAGRALLHTSGVAPAEVAFAGSHGQTIAHHPEKREAYGITTGATWQLGSLSVIAERLGVTTAGNFRARDVAAGGEGAPLLPWVDWLLFRDAAEGRVLLNIGGIANVTFLPAGGGEETVSAFDIGPGNMVVDAVTAALTGGATTHDARGERAARGRPDESLLAQRLAHPFFDRPPPRSTGREAFGQAYAEELIDAARRRGLSDDDIVATATALTVRAIADALVRWAPGVNADAKRRGAAPKRTAPPSSSGTARAPGAGRLASARDAWPCVHLSGGGGENPTMVRWLAEALAPIAVRTFDELGVPSRAREAVSFAVLADACLARRAANLPQVTGAAARVVLGEIAWGGEP